MDCEGIWESRNVEGGWRRLRDWLLTVIHLFYSGDSFVSPQKNIMVRSFHGGERGWASSNRPSVASWFWFSDLEQKNGGFLMEIFRYIKSACSIDHHLVQHMHINI